MAENEQLESNQEELQGRPRLHQLMQQMNPDKQYPEDGDDDINDMLALHEKHAGTSQRLAEGIKAHPGFAHVVGSLLEGKHPMHAVVAHYGKDVMAMNPESEEFAELMKADDEHTRMLEAEAKKEEENEKGKAEHMGKLAKAGEILEAFAKEKNMDEKATAEFMGKVQDEIVTPILEIQYTPDFFEAAYKWVNHDDHVEEAQEQGLQAGRAAGKNERIVAKTKDLSDGIPALKSGGADLNQGESETYQPDFWERNKPQPLKKH